jgi:hypothetical protein
MNDNFTTDFYSLPYCVSLSWVSSDSFTTFLFHGQHFFLSTSLPSRRLYNGSRSYRLIMKPSPNAGTNDDRIVTRNGLNFMKKAHDDISHNFLDVDWKPLHSFLLAQYHAYSYDFTWSILRQNDAINHASCFLNHHITNG